jgi:hypothetical protein
MRKIAGRWEATKHLTKGGTVGLTANYKFGAQC